MQNKQKRIKQLERELGKGGLVITITRHIVAADGKGNLVEVGRVVRKLEPKGQG